MSYGKYGMKMNVPTTNQQIPWSTNDTAYNIGSLLGTLWGENYNKRGINKAQESAKKYQDQYYAGTLGQPPAPQGVTDEMYSQALKAGAISNSKFTNASKGSSQPQYENANKKLGLPSGENASNSISPQDVIANEKWQFLKDKYGGPTPNPTGDAIAANQIASTVNGNLANLDVSKLPSMKAADAQAAIEAQLAKDGRTPYQIEQAMKSIIPTLQAKEKEYNDGMYNDLFEQYKDAVGTGNYTQAQMIGSQMLKYNPDAAKVAMAGLPTMRDQYNVAETNKRIDKQHKNKVFDMNYAAQLDKDKAKFNHDLSFNDFVRKNNYQISMIAKANGLTYEQAAQMMFGAKKNQANDQRMAAAKEKIADYQAWNKVNPDKPYPDQAGLKLANNYLTSVLNGGQQLSQVPANINDYAQMQDWLTQMKDTAGDRYSYADLAKIARQMLGSNSGYLEQAMKDRGWVK